MLDKKTFYNLLDADDSTLILWQNSISFYQIIALIELRESLDGNFKMIEELIDSLNLIMQKQTQI